jgi:Bacterial Ig-like domain (group 3)/FG-GAP-like repeat
MRFFPFALLCSIFLLSCTYAHCQNHQAATGDLNGDGKPDVVVVNSTLNNIGVFLNTGGAVAAGAFFAVPNRTDSISLADINSDGHLDILLVVANAGTSQLQAMLGDGKGGFAAPVAVPTAGATPITNTVIADFNGDGILDIAFGINAGSPQIAIIFGDGHGGFSASRVITAANDGTFADELVLLDANKDAKPDLVLNTASVTGGTHESFLLLNDGSANFSVSHLSSLNVGATNLPSGFVTAVADFNGDGNPDLLFGPNSSSFIMFGDGHGGALFASPVVSFIATPQGFAADVDDNQTIDLVSPTLGSYFPGNGHGGFGDPISLGLPPGSTLIAVADMNGDSKPDFIVQSGTDVSVVLNTLTVPGSISASTVLQLSASAETASVGLPVTLAASVRSYGGVPVGGTVTFFDGAQPLGSAVVNSYGVASISTSFSTAGLHNNLTASFSFALNALSNTFFSTSKTTSPSSVSVNTSQPTASAPIVTLTAFPNPARVLNPVTLGATVASSSGTPTGKVVFTADGNVVGIFGLPEVALVVAFPGLGPHNLQATYGGDGTFPQASSATLVENIQNSVPADFSIAASPQSATIKAGQTATFNITINPTGDMTSTVGFSCSGLPAASTCSFSPATLTPGINPVSTTLTVTTTAPSAAAPLTLRQLPPSFWTFVLASCFSLLLFAVLHRRQAAQRAALVWASIIFVFLLGSCGGGGSSSVPVTQNGTPPGTSSITVTAISATSHSSALSITVTP